MPRNTILENNPAPCELNLHSLSASGYPKMEMPEALSVYVHIPYCRQACTYCDFYFTTQFNNQNQFVECLIKEIELTAPYWHNLFQSSPKLELQTLYFGGGTPSVLSLAHWQSIIDTFTHFYQLSPNTEITIEVNPNDLNLHTLQAWKQLGFNRLSIGIQSFLDFELQWMNRNHNAKQSLEAIPLARQANFKNISIDLIFATPYLSLEQWQQTLETAFELQPEHISAYGLTVESQTALAHWVKKGKVIPAEDTVFEQHFRLLQDKMNFHGFEPYEISNYALPDFRSRHNSNYWNRIPYLGLGPAAHSFNGQSRFSNESNIHQYIHRINNMSRLLSDNNINSYYHYHENLGLPQHINEYLMTQLRRMEGISLAEFEKIFGFNLLQWRSDEINDFVAQGLMCNINNTLQLSIEGKLLADAITAELMYQE